MNSKIISAIVACVLFCVWTPHLLAMGGDYQVDTNGNIISQQPDWPSGLAELINSGPVFHGHWVNPNDEFFFLGDTGSLTRFLTRYSSLTNTPLVVVLHALLEGLDALRDVAHQVRNLAPAEQQQDDCDHDDPVPNAKRTHPATLQTRGRQPGPI